MEILNLQFAILCVVFAFCVLPGVLGVYMIAAGEDSKMDMRRWVCTNLFGVSNAFSYSGFVRFLTIAGSILILLSAAATGLFIYRYLFSA